MAPRPAFACYSESVREQAVRQAQRGGYNKLTVKITPVVSFYFLTCNLVIHLRRVTPVTFQPWLSYDHGGVGRGCGVGRGLGVALGVLVGVAVAVAVAVGVAEGVTVAVGVGVGVGLGVGTPPP
jgi:hypothetical protein